MRALTIFKFVLLFICLTPFNGTASGGPVTLTLTDESFISFTFWAVVATILCTEIFKYLLGFTKNTRRLTKVALSWTTGLNVVVVLFYAGAGFLAAVDLVFAMSYGLFIIMLANGVYSTKIIQSIISNFINLLKQEKDVH